MSINAIISLGIAAPGEPRLELPRQGWSSFNSHASPGAEHSLGCPAGNSPLLPIGTPSLPASLPWQGHVVALGVPQRSHPWDSTSLTQQAAPALPGAQQHLWPGDTWGLCPEQGKTWGLCLEWGKTWGMCPEQGKMWGMSPEWGGKCGDYVQSRGKHGECVQSEGNVGNEPRAWENVGNVSKTLLHTTKVPQA